MKIKILDKISFFKKDTKAISLPVFAGFALIAVTVVSTGIDINRYGQIKAALQAAADQSVLSASTLPKNQQIQACNRFFTDAVSNPKLKEFVVSETHTCRTETLTSPTGSYQGVRINAGVKVKTYFSEQLGLGTLDVDVTAVASEDKETIEVIYAFSTQGTMCATTTRNNAANTTQNQMTLTPDPTCNKFELTKQGITQSIDLLTDKLSPNKLQVGLVPFNYKVKLPNINNIPPSFLALEPDKQFFSEFTNEEPLPALVPLTRDYNGVRAALAAMTLSTDVNAWGRSDIGMHTAALMLDSTQNRYFSNHTPRNFGDSKKYVILMADGSNIGCCYTNNPTGNYDNQYIYFYEPYNTHMLDVCKNLKDNGVEIFTILLDVNVKDTGGPQMNNVMARCASGQYQTPAEETNANNLLECSKKSFCFNVDDVSKLDDAYAQITSIIAKPKLDQ